MIYLATPYSDPDPEVKNQRWHQAMWAMSVLAQHKIPCYCPIAAWHPVALEFNLPGDHEFWWVQDKEFMNACRAGWFIMFPGWESSRGMKAEREYLSTRKQVLLISPPDLPKYAESFARDVL
jgi:Domain of unknown function (DUF1937)